MTTLNYFALEQLRERLLKMGETDMGDLTRSEAALFHLATQAIDDLVASIIERSINDNAA